MTPEGFPGERVGRWTLKRLLGTGGFGSTWEALDESGRAVALKLLPHPPGDELRSLAAICHPCVPEVYDAGHLPRPFLAMRLVEGRPLSEWLKGSAPPLDLTLQFTAWIADALATVHQAKLTHSDVTPSNILVDQIHNGSLALIDFGLSGSETRGGTLHYASPEVLDGECASPASDVYGLGLIVWEMLHGSPPWPEMELSRALMQRGQAAPTPAAGPEWVRDLIQRMLAPEPSSRPSAQGLVDRLAEHQVNVPSPSGDLLLRRAHRVHIHTPSTQARIEAWMDQGGPLILMGREGCGRSHLIERVSDELRARGAPWVHFNAGGRPWDAVSQALTAGTLPGPALPLPHEGSREERAEMAAALLEERSGGQLHVVADDLEAIDEGSRAVLTALVERGASSVLVTAEQPPASWCVEPLILGPFADPSIRAYAHLLLGTIADPDTLVSRLKEATEGVPRDLMRLLVALVNQGGLTRRNQHWLIVDELWAPIVEQLPPAGTLPPLDETARDVATVLALRREPCSMDDLVRVSQHPLEQVRLAVDRLEEALLIRRGPQGFLPRTSETTKALRFAAGDARGIHQNLAQLLLDTNPSDPSIGWHLAGSENKEMIRKHAAPHIGTMTRRDTHEGLRLAHALWELCPATELAPARVEALVAAGQVDQAQAFALEALEDAGASERISLWIAYGKACLDVEQGSEEALRSVDAVRHEMGHEGPLVLRLIETRAHFEAGDTATAVSCAEGAPSPPEAVEELNDWLTLQGLHAQALHGEGELGAALALLENIPPSLGKDLPARVVVDGMLGRLLWHGGRAREAAQWLETVASRPSLSALNRGRTLNNAALACYQVGDRPGALAKWEDAMAQFERLRASLDMLRVAINLSVGYRELERPQRARKHGAWAVEEASSLGHTELHVVAMGNLGDVCFAEGDGEDAGRWYDKALQLAKKHDLVVDVAESARRLAHLAIAHHAPDAALRLLDAVNASNTPQTAIEQHRVRALQAWHQALDGQTHLVREELDLAITGLKELGADAELAETRLVAAQAFRAVGRTRDARRHAERVLAWATEMGHLQLRSQSQAMIESLPSADDDDDRLNLLLQLAIDVGRERNLNLLLKTVAESALQLLTGDRAFVVLREQGELRVAATHIRPGVQDTGRPSMAVVQRAIDQGREVIVADVNERSDLRNRESVVNMALRSVLCVPLVDGPSTLGAVYVDQTSGSVSDLTRAARFMRALAAHTAVAVGNAQTLQQAQRRAEWAAEAAHDLRGPIATVVSMLGGGPVDRQKAQEMKGLASHAMELADSVLRDGGVERKRMDLSALVQRACVALNHEVKVAHRTLHWSCIPGITVHGVPLDLRRALANLIRNGAKYSPEDGAVQVRLERQGTQAILTVRDEGPGLPPGDPRHLFGRGEHGQDSKSGTGLGLAIVAEAVQNHGGHISAANHPDGGAVFTIQLPVMCSDTEPTVSVS